MRLARWWLLLLAVLAWSCAASPSRALMAEGAREGPPPGASLLVYRALEEDAGVGAAFLPATALEGLGETLGAAGYATTPVEVEPAMARRPSRRGGPLLRRPPPPLLNPAPPPWSPQAYRWPPEQVQRVREQARQLYFQRLKEAQARYPKHHGYHQHHIVPMYLGGARDGATVRLPAAYHEAITQAFRREWSYSRRELGSQIEPPELLRILTTVYSEYPIPQLIGITP